MTKTGRVYCLSCRKDFSPLGGDKVDDQYIKVLGCNEDQTGIMGVGLVV